LRSKDQGQWGWKCKNCFSCIYSSKVDWFTSNQNHSDQRPILHISANTFHQRKCFVFVV